MYDILTFPFTQKEDRRKKNILSLKTTDNNDHKTKGTVRAEENKDPRLHQVVTKNEMAGV
mgnify:CR=1 FL=1